MGLVDNRDLSRQPMGRGRYEGAHREILVLTAHLMPHLFITKTQEAEGCVLPNPAFCGFHRHAAAR